MKRLSKSMNTLRVRIIAIVALCWLLPTLVLGVYMSSVFFSALRTKTEQALEASASHAQDLTVQEIDRVLRKSKDVTYDEQVYMYVTQYKAGSISFEEFYVYARSYWWRMFQRERMMPFTMVFLIDEPDKQVYTTTDAGIVHRFNENVLPYVLQVGEKIDTRSRFIYVDDNLFHVRNLYNRRLERFGMLVLNLDPEQLLEPLLSKNQLWQGQVDISLDEYTRVANPDYPFQVEGVTFGLQERGGDLYYAQRVKTSDYTLVYRIRVDQSIIYGQVHEYYQLIIALLLLLVPLEALIMLFIHRSLTRPLVQLANAAQRMAGGELGVTVPLQGRDEIGRVGMAFNAMSLHIQHLIDKSYREELALRDARISALQSRINPHFMNNALELMNWEARMEGAEGVGQMIEAMSTLMNAAMDWGDQNRVPLFAEVEIADAYFFFIAQRFGERVKIIKNIDESLRTVMVPRLIIQTLLENAVEHGINPVGAGTIRLNVYAQRGMLFIDVRNNGKLLSEAEQKKVDELLREPGRDARIEHMGIRNINTRLKLTYNDRAFLWLGTDCGETLARITIPLDEVITAEESEQQQTTNNMKNQ